MINFSGTTNFYLEGPTALTLGKFEGVHLGHQKLMRRVMQYAKAHEGTVSAVFSIRPGKGEQILTKKEQMQAIGQMGMEALIDCPFVPEISTMPPETFVEEVLLRRLHAVYIAVGTDFRFAYKRQGDSAFLKENEKRYGLVVDVIEKETYKGREISSTYIREMLQEGDAACAAALMGRPYSLEGTVIHGAHLGSKLGMPTANLIPDPEKLLPAFGVYVSRTILDGKTYGSVTNIGTKPTVNGSFAGAETYLLDLEIPDRQGLYGKNIRVELLSFLRPERRFGSLEELKKQVREDISRGAAYHAGKDTL